MIKFTYFDIGGVALQDFTGKNWGETISSKIKFGKYGNLYSLWILFLKNISVKYPKLYKKYILSRVVKLTQNKEIWPVIDHISNKTKIGLLTNMYPNYLDQIKKSDLLPKSKWNAVVDSSVVGYLKPDPNIYRVAEEKCGFKGNEILFIDNTKQNVDAAIKFGWNGFLYDPNNCKDSSKKLLEYFKSIN